MKEETFDLFGSPWKIIYCDKIDIKDEEHSEDKFQWGLTDYINRVISIATKNKNGEDMPDSEIQLTKLHEIMHCILTTGMYCAYSDDEPLVEWLARSIYSLRKQEIIK